MAQFNPHSLIAARLLTRNKDARDRPRLRGRASRGPCSCASACSTEPYYRLIHAEADGLPGLVVDRFGDTLVVQVNTAGMDVLERQVVAALDEVLPPRTIIARNDAPARQLEGLTREVKVLKGELPERLELVENGLTFVADPAGGQKTGWFYDQRANRRFAASSPAAQAVLDVYSYCGGFALTAAAPVPRR